MLILSRKEGQKIVIDEHITIIVTHVNGNRIKLGIEAPPHISVKRDELAARMASPALAFDL